MTTKRTVSSSTHLIITAEFNGILPKEAREKARAAKDHFDNLYLIIDQQKRWKSALLPDPRPRALDPLLIGELKQGRRSKFFLIHQFDLTGAEQYLTDEFTTNPDGLLPGFQQRRCDTGILAFFTSPVSRWTRVAF